MVKGVLYGKELMYCANTSTTVMCFALTHWPYPSCFALTHWPYLANSSLVESLMVVGSSIQPYLTSIDNKFAAIDVMDSFVLVLLWTCFDNFATNS